MTACRGRLACFTHFAHTPARVRIALLYNSPPPTAATSPVAADDEFEEYDDLNTIASIAEALDDFGTVVPVEADASLFARLQAGRFDIAFNIAEGHGRRSRESHAAAVCEMLNVRVTHSDAVALGVTLDKMLARRVVTPEVPVAPAAFVDLGDCVPTSYPLRFPVVVKPNDEGSSKGIRDDSIATDPVEAHRLVTRLRRTYGCPVLVEQYLSSTEVTVGLLGNGDRTEILGVMEIAPAEASARFLYSVEVKRAFRARVRYHMPPRLPCATRRTIEAYARTAYRLLGCRDVARMDFRLDASGVPHFLECNPLPGLRPDAGDLVIMTRDRFSHRELVHAIFRVALQRYGMCQ